MNQDTETTIIQKEQTPDVILRAVDKLVDTVKPTYGPASNKVIIDKPIYRMVVDDGVQIARDFQLNDPIENAVVKVVRETAIKTNDRVGDGTTSSLIMLQAIMRECRRRGMSGREVELELKAALNQAREQLESQKRDISTKAELEAVARVSFDDDAIASMISELYEKMGPDAVITVDKSPSMETYSESTDGLRIESGYLSPYMVTNPQRMEANLEKPLILVTDYRLTEHTDVLPIMEKLVKANRRELVIIAENIEQKALATLVANRVEGKFHAVGIAFPKNEADISVLLEDIALMTGATLFSESKGNRLENATVEDLGSAKRFTCYRDESVIIEPSAKEEIGNAVTDLRSNIAVEKDEKTRDLLEQRVGRMTNSIAVIKVGAATEQEQKALKYKVEDAVNAVRSAFQNGVVCGAGLSLAGIKTDSNILNRALKYPNRQLFENVGMDMPEDLPEGHALNVVTGKVGPYMEVGVVDPVDVLLAGVESAVSIASLLLTSAGMVVEHAKDQNDA